jgi:histone arginine demethylase JMJD6
MTTQNTMTIEKRSDLSYREFIDKYQKPGIPVVLENATKIWKNNMVFTPEFFKENFGNRTTRFTDREYTVSEMLDLTANSTKENPAPYPVKFDILTQLPELLSYMDPLHMDLIKPNWLKSKVLKNKLGNAMDLHIGGAGNHYSVHKDAYDVHAWLIQFYGEKQVIVFPRDQEELMYPGKGGLLESRSPIDISNPDYEKYPRFREATPITVTLKAGEVMYIPSGIWHTTMAHGQNISTIVDQVNNSNYKAWRRDVYVYKKYHNKYRAVIDYGAATAIGNACRLGELFGMKF